MTNSRRKGKRGEYIVRDLLRKWGFESRRGIQAAGEPDNVHNIPGYHVEVKNDERLSIWKMLQQAEHDAAVRAQGEEPLLFFKRNNTKVYGALDAECLLRLLRLQATYYEFRELNDV